MKPIAPNKSNIPAKLFSWSRSGLVMWLVMVMLALGQLLLRQPLFRFWQQQGRDPATIRRENWIERLYQLALAIFATMGLMVLRRRENPRMGWLMLSLGFLTNLESFCKDYAIFAYFTSPTKKRPLRALAGWLQHWIWTVRISGLFIFLPLLFPNGRLPSSWWRPFMHQVVIDYIVRLPAYMFAKIPLENGLLGLPPILNPFGNRMLPEWSRYLRPLSIFAGLPALVSLWQTASPGRWRRLGLGLYFGALVLANQLSDLLRLAIMCLVSAASLIWRWRSATADERQQIKWLAYVSTLASGLWSIYNLPIIAYADDKTDLRNNFQLAYRGVLIGSPIALGLAIMKYRLYDIDLLIKRTLVYVPLTTLVIGIYSTVVSLLGKIFQRQTNNTLSSLVATGIVAVLFQPMRERLQQAVNRHLYGERDDPIGVITKLAGQLETDSALSAMLPTLIETAATVLKLPYIGLQARDQQGVFNEMVTYGERPSQVESLPLLYQGETIGHLMVAPRAPGEAFSQADQRLLTTISQLAATTVRTVTLTDELQASRMRVVTSREEERRRIRRDLHDGLGPSLASQTLKLDAVLELLAENPQAAGEQVQLLKTQSQQMVADIRRLVYELRPPALDELGLLEALRAHLAQMSDDGGRLHISVEADSDPLPALSAAVEIAAYRIVLEAVTNVVRHAGAKTCLVRLSIVTGASRARHLALSISDDGAGLPLDFQSGVGLASIRERAEELGGVYHIGNASQGGVVVRVTLPLPQKTDPGNAT